MKRMKKQTKTTDQPDEAASNDLNLSYDLKPTSSNYESINPLVIQNNMEKILRDLE